MKQFSSSGHGAPLRLALGLLCCTSICQGLNIRGNAPVPHLTTSTTSVSTLSTTSTTTAAPPSTITPPPPWGDQVLPVNTCFQSTSDGTVEYFSCTMHQAMVDISYFPTVSSGNETYPSTFYNTKWNVTMTSPLIYMLVTLAQGSNACGTFGPAYTSKVVSMPISEALTMQPFANAAAVSRMGPPRQLTLTDLDNCEPLPDNLWELIPVIVDLHPNYDDVFHKCNPHFIVPPAVRALGGPYWKNCGLFNDEIGVFDPPGAIPPADDLFIPTTDSPIATPAPNIVDPPKTTTPSSTPTSTSTSISPSKIKPTPTSTSKSISKSASKATPTTDIIVVPNIPDIPDDKDKSTKTVTKTAAKTATNSAINTSTKIATITAALTKPVIIGTIDSLTITAVAGASTVIVGSQTATIGGPKLTLENQVVVSAALTALDISTNIPSGRSSSLAWPTAAGVVSGEPHKVTEPSVGVVIASLIAAIIGVSLSVTPIASLTLSPITKELSNHTSLTTVTSLSLGNSTKTSTLLDPLSKSLTTSSHTQPTTTTGQTSEAPTGTSSGERPIALGRWTIIAVICSIWYLAI